MTSSTQPRADAAPGLTFRRELRVEWGHCDPAGIVFYPRYFEFFDANTAYLFEAAGLPKLDVTQTYDIIGMPLVDVQAKFLLPSRFGDSLVIESGIGQWRRSSFTVTHRIFKGSELAVDGHESRVWAGKDPERPDAIKVRPIPGEVIDRFVRSQADRP